MGAFIRLPLPLFYSAPLHKKSSAQAGARDVQKSVVLHKTSKMSEGIKCPKCSSEYTYEQNCLMVCSQCFHEFDPNEISSEERVLDANGNELAHGDAVVVVKDLPVKGAPKPVKAGTKVKNIRLRPDSDHNIDCKIDGFGSMALKSEFVRKA